MQRRVFLGLVALTAASWPALLRAQQSATVWRINLAIPPALLTRADEVIE